MKRPFILGAFLIFGHFGPTPSLLAEEVGIKTPETLSVASPQLEELRYPPIRLSLAEAPLSPPLIANKDELIQGSQVFEDAIHKSGAVFRDPELEKLLQEALPLEALGEQAKGFQYRIYIIKDPTVNAMTTPTGSIYINSGLLAAMSNTDQIRLVIAHEAHHVIDQDIVYQYKKMKDEVGAINMLRLVATPVVAVAIGENDMDTGRVIANVYTSANLAISISYQLSFLGYGRDNENECDLFAMKIFNSHNYDLENARQVFMLFDKEQEKYEKGFRSHYLSDHETGKQRAERVEKFMKEVGYKPPAAVEADQRYNELTHEIRIENARLNIQLRRPWHAADDLEELQKLFPQDARIPCLLGRAYASISDDSKILKEELSGKTWKDLKINDEKIQQELWSVKAAEYFAKSIELDPVFAEPHRELGLLCESQEKLEESLPHLEKYLELNAQGKDIRYVKSRVEKIKSKIQKKQEEELKKIKKEPKKS